MGHPQVCKTFKSTSGTNAGGKCNWENEPIFRCYYFLRHLGVKCLSTRDHEWSLENCEHEINKGILYCRSICWAIFSLVEYKLWWTKIISMLPSRAKNFYIFRLRFFVDKVRLFEMKWIKKEIVSCWSKVLDCSIVSFCITTGKEVPKVWFLASNDFR